MSTIISGSIDLSKIKKEKIVNHKNGSKYYSIQIFLNDEKDKYGNDVSIKENLTKEEREGGAKAEYIGNGKIVHSGNGKAKKDEPREQSIKDDSDLPF